MLGLNFLLAHVALEQSASSSQQTKVTIVALSIMKMGIPGLCSTLVLGFWVQVTVLHRPAGLAVPGAWDFGYHGCARPLFWPQHVGKPDLAGHQSLYEAEENCPMPSRRHPT